MCFILVSRKFFQLTVGNLYLNRQRTHVENGNSIVFEVEVNVSHQFARIEGTVVSWLLNPSARGIRLKATPAADRVLHYCLFASYKKNAASNPINWYFLSLAYFLTLF